jgi:hypothetical protein
MGKLLIRFLLVFAFLPLQRNVPAQAQIVQYLCPAPGSLYNPAGTTIAIRYGDLLDGSTVDGAKFVVQGSLSGRHLGSAILADDRKTVIFTPYQPFTLGETVDVTVQAGLASTTGKVFGENAYSFNIRKNRPSVPAGARQLISGGTSISPQSVPTTIKPQPSIPAGAYVTAPSDFPAINITTPANGTADGYLFASTFDIAPPINRSYLLMLDNNGEPVYYQRLATGDLAFDFRKLPDGTLAYWDQIVGGYVIMDNTYQVIRTIKAQNGFASIDLHDLLLLPNGDFMFMIYDYRTIDLTQYGGSPTATVIALVIQELDASDHVVFQWDSMEKDSQGNVHIPLTDTYMDLTATGSVIDYVHGNAIDLDSDGNILMSARHLSAITKINHTTGEVMWRLGGKENQFQLVKGTNITDDPTFSFQHDIRRLPNGNITLFDNHNNLTPMDSRGMEFSLDEGNKIATLEWVYHDTPEVATYFMGSVQRFANGNTLIGWGSSPSPSITEVKPDGSKAFEMTFDGSLNSYRAFRATWNGYPTWAPVLAENAANNEIQLFFSWNGATDVSAYQVLGGNTNQPTTLLTTQTKNGFETSVTLTDQQLNYCYYRVMPLDLQSQPTQYSNVVLNPSCGMKTYLSVISK